MNCGKIGHTFETCHNRKRKVPIVSTTIVKSTKLIANTITQPTKLVRIHV
jgi:hypothetical protein